MVREIKSVQEADGLIDGPEPVWILKHSTSCPISAYAMQEFMQYVETHPDEQAAVVIVQRNRDVSSHIAQRLKVRHESPQILLVGSGAAMFHASHGDITVETMEQVRSGV